MNVQSIIFVIVIALALAVPALAQPPAAVSAPPSAAMSATPAAASLESLLGSRAADLRAAGIQKVAARTDKQKRAIQLLTSYGPVYFGWPKNVAPVPFEIELGQGNTLVVRASGYTEATKAQYIAAFDAVIPEALRRAAAAKAYAERPRT